MEELEVDGVPVFWAPVPGPLTASLMFGVGSRDETFRTIGVTHLIEHLVMSTMPPVHYEHNAQVDLGTTEFHATGRPEHIVAFLAVVCAALGRLPLHRLGTEIGVLAAEGASGHLTPMALLRRRFGVAGLGLTGYNGPGYDRLTVEHVLSHAQRFFVRGNAVLTLTGPPPDGLRLPLPPGERACHDVPPTLPGFGWAAESIPPSAGLGLHGPARHDASTFALRVLRDRLVNVARHDRGISYDVGGTQVRVDNARNERMIWLDARSGQERQAATLLWDTAVAIAGQGPTPDELAYQLDGLRHQIEDPRYPGLAVSDRAVAWLFGAEYRSPERILTNVAAVTPADVATALAAEMASALLVVPNGTRLDVWDGHGVRVPELPECPLLPAAPPGREFRARRAMRVVNRWSRGVRLVLTHTGLAYVDGDEIHYTDFQDVVGVRCDAEGNRILYARHGCVLPVVRELFTDADQVIGVIDRAVPGWLYFTPSELAPGP